MILTLTDCSFCLGRNVANVRSSITLMLEPVSSIIVRWAFSTLTLVCGNFVSGLASLSVYRYSRSLSVCTWLMCWSRRLVDRWAGVCTGFPPHLSLFLQHVAKWLVLWQLEHRDPRSGHCVCPPSWGHLPPQLKHDLSSCGMRSCFGRMGGCLTRWRLSLTWLTIVVCDVLRTALFWLSVSSSVFANCNNLSRDRSGSLSPFRVILLLMLPAISCD